MLTLQKLSPFLIRNIVFKTLSSSTSIVHALNEKPADKISTKIEQTNRNFKPKNPIVAAAFQSLKEERLADPFVIDENNNEQKINDISIDERIVNAKTVMGLLMISESHSPLSRQQALKIVSILSEWTTINKAKLSEFESDSRFLKLCRILGRTVSKGTATDYNGHNKKITGFRTDDLNTVLGITGDDEAAKLISSISLPQMVKIMSTLAQKKRRSTPLLRSLAYNISSNSSILDLKQCGDLLFSMAILNFPDPILIGRICTDLHSGLEKNINKPAVVGSILTSLGMLKYRDLDALEALTGWIINHQEVCRSHDISSLFLTLATLNYTTTQANFLRDNLSSSITEHDLRKAGAWLDYVWGLAILDFVKSHQIDSVLNPQFIETLIKECSGSLTPTIKMKLLNINSVAKNLVDHKGFLLKTEDLFEIALVHSKSKQVLVNGMLDALKSLVSTSSNIQTHIDSKMGFVIDAVCIFDKKGNPINADKADSTSTRLAIMVQDYFDLCQGNNTTPTGVSELAKRLLEKNNFKVLTIPYIEFNISDKLIKRVQYLESKLKAILNNKK